MDKRKRSLRSILFAAGNLNQAPPMLEYQPKCDHSQCHDGERRLHRQ
jgi:hypothetical protein